MIELSVGHGFSAEETALVLDRLERLWPEARRRFRSKRTPGLLSVSIRTRSLRDPSAVISAARRPGEAWFCLEQPAHLDSVVASLGCLRAIEAGGADRFANVHAQFRDLVRDFVSSPAEGPPGSGLSAHGGFAFAPGGGNSRRWQGFAPASLVIPEISLVRRVDEVWLTLNLEVQPGEVLADLRERVGRQLSRLRPSHLPLFDPSPVGRSEVVSPMPPAHYEEAVARAVQRIQAGEMEKIVLAREVEVHAPRAHDPAAVLGLLREAFPSCYVFAVGRGNATFLAASPELLIRREGQRASTVALAGSIRRSADPAVDDHLGEQLLSSAKDREENAIVAHRIASRLRPHSVWVSAATEPGLVRVANIQHLGAPIRAQLRSPIDAVSLAGLLHPTPAVGGEPDRLALELIPALEGMDRGWYAGPVGWTDSMGDGEFCVALRCALLRGSLATCFAGAGVVRDSDPAAELAETEVKLQALLPLLAG